MPKSIALTPAEQAVAATFANQTSWLQRITQGRVFRQHLESARELVFASANSLGVSPPTIPDIDDALNWLEGHSTGNLLVWSAQPNADMDLALHARGARESFRPQWMHRSLANTLPSIRQVPEIEIVRANPSDFDALVAARNVPYTRTPQLGRILHLATGPGSNNDVVMLLARRASHGRLQRSPGSVVGAGILHLTGRKPDRHGVIFNLGVAPEWRNRGIGSALNLSLCHLAREMGAAGISLNATPQGESVYRNQGFAVSGEGQTWFIGQAALLHRPSAPKIANAEALGRGETARLDPQVGRWKTMPNGDTPIAFAARFNQADVIAWLLDHHAIPDIVPLWSTGYHDEAIAAMENPRWLNAQRLPELTSPIHEAIHLNDERLVRQLLHARPNLELRDNQWNGRPLE